MNSSLEALKNKILAGGNLSEEEAYSLLDFDSAELREAAAEVTSKMCTDEFEPCSIINARSGRCPENCKWCAQSGHYDTGCHNYEVVGHRECVDAAGYNHQRGVKRFSLVASGKRVSGKVLDEMCGMLRDIRDNVGIELCASMGLLTKESLAKLKDSGVQRYHCNLETAPSHFATLCTTHSIEDKIATIDAARDLGMEICSGGIIGMGESRRQ